MIDYEQRGGYPGDKTRRKERYPWFGGICLHWIRKWLSAGTPEFIYPLVLHGSPMLAVAIYNADFENQPKKNETVADFGSLL